jgi:hypothetical protein
VFRAEHCVRFAVFQLLHCSRMVLDLGSSPEKSGSPFGYQCF